MLKRERKEENETERKQERKKKAGTARDVKERKKERNETKRKKERNSTERKPVAQNEMLHFPFLRFAQRIGFCLSIQPLKKIIETFISV